MSWKHIGTTSLVSAEIIHEVTEDEPKVYRSMLVGTSVQGIGETAVESRNALAQKLIRIGNGLIR